VYSVPSETNYLADVFSRSFNTSRFLDKRKFVLSKIQANKIPPLTDPFIVDEGTLYAYFSNTLNSEDSDTFNRNRAKISTPKPIKNLYKLFEKCTPEEKCYSAIRLLQGWNDPSIKPTVKLNSIVSEETEEVIEDPIDILERNDILLFTQHCEQVIKETMESHYKTSGMTAAAVEAAATRDAAAVAAATGAVVAEAGIRSSISFSKGKKAKKCQKVNINMIVFYSYYDALESCTREYFL
jgi:hypothetical protein